jgi:acyl dehydratase
VSELWNPAPAVGQTYTTCLVENLSRRHIAEYAGASGDFNLVHTDESFAVNQAGRPSVIAHGMLTMGLTATFLTRLAGQGSLASFGGRFRAPVLPGQRLTSTVTVGDVSPGPDGDAVSLHVVTHADAGEVVFEGYAVARHCPVRRPGLNPDQPLDRRPLA